MKRTFFKLSLFTCVLFISLLSCKKDDASTKDNDTCLLGTWYFTENNFQKSFTFNDDSTGVEVQAANDIRNFTWTMKDNQPVIVYVGETPEWTFSLDCDKNELSIFGAVYKKE